MTHKWSGKDNEFRNNLPEVDKKLYAAKERDQTEGGKRSKEDSKREQALQLKSVEYWLKKTWN